MRSTVFPSRYLTVFHTGAGAQGAAARSDLVGLDDSFYLMNH